MTEEVYIGPLETVPVDEQPPPDEGDLRTDDARTDRDGDGA